ncbi:ribosome maturation factor RimM [Calditerricola yamamurae]|jgi:16S rRNA processing protein RimM
MVPKRYNVGKLVNTHGIRGEVRVISITDFPEQRYRKGSRLWLSHPDFPQPIELVVESHRRHKQFDLLKFEGYDSINDVEKFKGGMLQVAEEDLEPLPEGEYYYHEIIGCTVVTEEGEELGTVKEILSPGANDVWVVARKGGGKDILIPYIDDVVKDVDVAKRRVTVHLLPGLVE